MPATRSMLPQWPLAARILSAMLLVSLVVGCQGNMAPWKAPSFAGRQPELKNPTRTHLSFAKLSERTGNLQAARESYLTVLDENPQSVEATIGLAGLDLRAGNVRDAELGFLKAGELAPNDPLVAEALGQFYLSQDRFRDAEQFLRQGYEANPTDRRLQYRLGLALARQRRMAEAEPLFVQSVGEPEADYNLGLILYEQGETIAAEQRLLRAVMKKPTLNEAQHWLEVVRNERATQMIAQGQRNPMQQSPLQQSPIRGGNGLPYGALNPAIGAEHTSQAELGSLSLAARQALEQQQLQRQQEQFPQPQQRFPRNTRQLPQQQFPVQQYQHGLQQSGLQVSPGPANESALAPQHSQMIQSPVQQHQTLDTSRMTATQIQQLQNSMTPQQRMALQQQLQMQQR